MKSNSIAALLALCAAGTTLASQAEPRGENCVTKAEADDIVARWTSLAISINSDVADATVTNDFQFFSDSQNFLEGTAYGSVTGIPSINGKADLIAQQEVAQGPGTTVIPQSFTILKTIHGCHHITFRWRFHAISSGTDPNSTNSPGDPVEYSGLDVLFVTKNTHKIKIAYSEWNNGELLFDLGTRTCFQKDNPSACT